MHPLNSKATFQHALLEHMQIRRGYKSLLLRTLPLAVNYLHIHSSQEINDLEFHSCRTSGFLKMKYMVEDKEDAGKQKPVTSAYSL